jgi:hypothetical protein
MDTVHCSIISSGNDVGFTSSRGTAFVIGSRFAESTNMKSAAFKRGSILPQIRKLPSLSLCNHARSYEITGKRCVRNVKPGLSMSMNQDLWNAAEFGFVDKCEKAALVENHAHLL